MNEYSRILIENYIRFHNSAKSRRLQKLLDMSYDFCEPSDSDALFLEKAIDSEKDVGLRGALEDLDEYLFGM